MKIPETAIKPFDILGWPTVHEIPPPARILQWEFAEISITYPMVRHERDCTCNWCTKMNELVVTISK